MPTDGSAYAISGSNEPVLPTLEEHAWVQGYIAISGSNEPVLPTLEEHAWYKDILQSVALMCQSYQL